MIVVRWSVEHRARRCAADRHVAARLGMSAEMHTANVKSSFTPSPTSYLNLRKC